jgi:hypothetical protein
VNESGERLDRPRGAFPTGQERSSRLNHFIGRAVRADSWRAENTKRPREDVPNLVVVAHS